MNLIDHAPAQVSEHGPGRGGEHQVQRLGSGNEHVGRAAHQRLPLGGRRVAGPHRDTQLGMVEPQLSRGGSDPLQRYPQVALDILVECLERGDVEQLDLVLGQRAPAKLVETGEEGGQRLARAGGSQDESMVAAMDGGPTQDLGRRGPADSFAEPLADGRREEVQDGGRIGDATDGPTQRFIDRLSHHAASLAARR